VRTPTLIIISFISFELAAQTYIPFPTVDAIWCFEYIHGSPDGEYLTYYDYEYRLADSVIIGGKEYINVMLTHLSEVNCCKSGYPFGGNDLDYEVGLVGAIREEDKKIYFYKYDLPDAPGDNLWMEENNQEYLLYDFNLSLGDSIKFSPCLDLYSIVTETDSILLNDGLYHRKLSLFDRDGGNHSWVEGVGDLTGLLGSYVCVFEGSYWELYNTKINDEFVYFKYNCAYGEVSVNDPALPQFEIYPNPSDDYIQIRSSSYFNNSILLIYDLYGNKLISRIMLQSNEFVDVSNLLSGSYLLFIVEGDKIYGGKMFNKI
jgi:hypothetical protein